MHFSDFMLLAGVIQNTLGDSRFSGINMSDDSNVSGFF